MSNAFEVGDRCEWAILSRWEIWDNCILVLVQQWCQMRSKSVTIVNEPYFIAEQFGIIASWFWFSNDVKCVRSRWQLWTSLTLLMSISLGIFCSITLFLLESLLAQSILNLARAFSFVSTIKDNRLFYRVSLVGPGCWDAFIRFDLSSIYRAN